MKYSLSSDFNYLEFTPDGFSIEEHQNILGEKIEQYQVTRVQTKEKMIREGLMALGWLPPGNSMEEFRRHWMQRVEKLHYELAQANQLAAHWEEQAAEYKAKLLELEVQK